MKNRSVLLVVIVLMSAAGFTLSTGSPVSANAVSAVRQAKPEKPLDKAAADALVGEPKEGLADLLAPYIKQN